MNGWLTAVSAETTVLLALFSWTALRLVRQLDANTKAIEHLERALTQIEEKLRSHIEVVHR
jgi:hypothetical protein